MLTTFGGLALFLLGIERITRSLQELSGPGMRRAMASATRGPLRALLTGTAVSAATQSGTATAVTVLGLVTSGLLAVREAIAMSLGAKVGATLAIQLAAFEVDEAALPLVGIGFALLLWPRARHLGGLLLGAGMLFLGLDITVSSVADLRSSELFRLVVDAAERQPLLVMVVGAGLGALLSSTNGVTAVALGLYAATAVSLPTALALVVGGNVGGTVLPVLAARSLGRAAQRVALVHVAVKAAGALATVLALGYVAQAIAAIGGDGARQIANAHSLFNVAVAVPGTILAGYLARLAARAMPEAEDAVGPKYLRTDALDEPTLAIALAQRETVRVSDHVAVMTDLAATGLRRGVWDIEATSAREAKVDLLTRVVVEHLAALRRRHGEDPDSERLLLVVTELEHMGDQVRRLMRRNSRLRDSGLEFSREGRAELADTGQEVLRRMRTAFTALATGDVAMAERVIRERPDFERRVAQMRIAHLSRLEAQLPESQASSAHHLEILTLLRQIDASVTRVAGWALESTPRGAPSR